MTDGLSVLQMSHHELTENLRFTRIPCYDTKYSVRKRAILSSFKPEASNVMCTKSDYLKSSETSFIATAVIIL